MTQSKFDEWWNGRIGFHKRTERFNEQVKRLNMDESTVNHIKAWLEQAYNQGYDQGHLDCYATYRYDDEE